MSVEKKGEGGKKVKDLFFGSGGSKVGKKGRRRRLLCSVDSVAGW